MGDTTESGMAGLKKAAIGALTILVTAGAGWFATNFFGGDSAKAASPPPIEVNINNENNQMAAPTVIVIESTDTVEVESADPAKKKPKW